MFRPKFTKEQAVQLHALIEDEVRYLDSDAPVCMFHSVAEADALHKLIGANTKRS